MAIRARQYPVLSPLGYSQRTAACAFQHPQRRSGGMSILTLLLALPGLSVGLAGVSQAQSSGSEHTDYWRQNYRAQWRKQWEAEHAAKPSAVKKASAPARSAVVTSAPAPTKPEAQTHSSAPSLPAAPAAAIQTPNPKIETPDVLAQTQADAFAPEAAPTPAKPGDKSHSHLQDNAFAPLGDAWRMLAYLVPMLLVIVGCLNLLKRFQARTGRLPGFLQSAATSRQGAQRSAAQPRPGGVWNAILGGFHLNNAREQAGRSIRVIESVPIGGANVHLLEVRGRVLLLGATAGSLSLLAEFDERAEAGSEDFRDLLHAAAADMDTLDYAQPDLPAAATVSVLEDLMRDTGQAVAQRSRRLRTVQEVEGEE